MPRVRIPFALLRTIDVPRTHEVGGHLLMGGGHRIDDVVTFAGDQCRTPAGERLSGAAQCKIHKPDAAISFHTHPQSNRPSSADMRNAVLKHPQLSKRGKRLLSMVMTPKGLWWYTPTRALRAAWKARLRQAGGKAWVQQQMREWSRAGRRCIPGDPAALCAYMQQQGLALHYLARDAWPSPHDGATDLHIARDGTFRVAASSEA